MLFPFLGYAPSLLLWFWILASGSVIATLLPVPLPEAFKDAVRLSAARGKLWSQRPQNLGALNNMSVPQSWFLHFYAIGSACCATVLALTAASRAGAVAEGQMTTMQDQCTFLALGLLTLHLLRRLLETGCMMVYPPAARMHVIAYVFGCTYYIVAPLSLMPDSFWAPARVSGSLASWLQPAPGMRRAALLQEGLLAAPAQLQMAVHALLQEHAWLHAAGALVMTLGFLLQFHSHWVLSRLAKQPQRAAPPGSSEGYVIPRGGMFEYVSCPHYLGEVVIYLGLALLCWPSAKPLLMLLWVVVNLVLAAGATQRWYKSHFPKYPRRRRALIPFVF